MPNAPKREKRQKKLPVKKEIGGESTAKPVFQIKTPKKKKKSYESKYQETDNGDVERNRCGGGDPWWRW